MKKNYFISYKDSGNIRTYCLFNILPIFKKNMGIVVKNNTFIVWEPCSQSHAEVVPGYVKYLTDLGYHVSVVMNPKRYKEGLFERFSDEDITLNILSRRKAKNLFKKSDLKNVQGLLVTTSGKICDCIHYEQCYEHFAPNVDKSKLFIVEHDVKLSVDNNCWDESVITLRKLNYKGASSVVVNPQYFGRVNVTSKNKDVTNFITIGALNPKRRNSSLIINAAAELYKKGYKNFKITVVGKGHLKDIPSELHTFFDIKGRLPFNKMYDELEKADFLLTAYEENDSAHQRYNTTGTSGAFQLMYGFKKPAVILESFAPINGLNNENSVLYENTEEYSQSMERCINISSDEYEKMQNNLMLYAEDLYNSSRENLKALIVAKKKENN